MPRLAPVALGVVLMVLSGGCALPLTTEQMNERHVQSCIYTWGFLSPFYVVRTISATGGLTIEDCHKIR